MSSEKRDNESKSVAIWAMLVAFGTMISRISGLLREMVLAAFFPRIVTDAYIVAFRLPNMFRRLLGEGSLSVSFVPVFVESIEKNNQDDARAVANGIYTILLIVTSTLTGLGIYYMGPVIDWVVSGQGYQSVPGKMELTVKFARIVFGFIFLMSNYAFFMGILQSHRIFTLPALAPALFNLTIIIAGLLPETVVPRDGMALAYAVMIGGFLQAAILIPKLIQIGHFPRLSLNWAHPRVKLVLSTMIPSMLGMGILQFTNLINVKLASHLPQGTHSYFNWADRLLELPMTLVGVSIGTTLLPTLSRQLANDDRQGMGETATHYLRLSYFLAVPCAIAFFFFSKPLVELIYYRGLFSLEDVEKTAMILQIYTFVLLVGVGIHVMNKPFFATKNTWLPAVSAVIGMIFHVVVAWKLMPEYGIRGLAFASIVSSGTNFAILMISYRFQIGSLQLMKLIRSFGKFLAAGAIMLLALQVYEPLWSATSGILWPEKTSRFVHQNGFGVQLARALCIFLVIGLCGAVYFAMSYLLKVEELHQTLGTLVEKIKRRRQKN